jgi:hypothetical protein
MVYSGNYRKRYTLSNFFIEILMLFILQCENTELKKISGPKYRQNKWGMEDIRNFATY